MDATFAPAKGGRAGVANTRKSEGTKIKIGSSANSIPLRLILAEANVVEVNLALPTADKVRIVKRRHPTVITSSEAKVEKLKALGATEVLNSIITAAWEQVVLELTGGRGVEHVVEAVGPATLEQSIKASGFDSQIALMGVFPSEAPDHSGFNPKVLSARLLTIRRIVGSRAAFTAMNQAIALHQLHPVIDRSFSFLQALEAYRYFDKARPFGKVVISSE